MVCRFLLVSLCIDAILGEVTVSEWKRKLNEMTKGNHLGGAYATTLDRMKAQKGSRYRLGMDALMWVSNSERPLQTSELCHALGVKIGSADLDLENVPTIRTLLGCSLGLITVEASSSTVRLVHLTLQEYLSNNPSLFQSPHSMMAEVCLTYLSFQCIRGLSPTLCSAPSTFLLLEYASCYWGKHIRRGKAQSVPPIALELLIEFERHISSHLLLVHYDKNRRQSEPRFDRSSFPHGFTGLHGGAFLGLGEIVAALLVAKGWNINATDAMGRTALLWAAIGGHENVVKVLLQQKDVNPNAGSVESGQTPLWWAAQRGHERIVSLLLEREDIIPNTKDTAYGRTPLICAAEGGCEAVVKLLLERRDIGSNTADTTDGRTLFVLAAKGGHEGVVRLLLGREDINPNTTDTKYGETPLWAAVMDGREEIVEVLLQRRDLNPNTPDAEYGRTPLWLAAKRWYKGIVGLLLKRDNINPNIPDTLDGRTPLMCAAWDQHETVVKLLLEREDI